MKCNFLHSSAFSAFIFRGIWTTVSSQTNKVLPKHWQSAFLEKFIFRKAEDKTCEKTACWTKCPESWRSYNSLIHCFVLLMSLFNVFTGQSLSSRLLSVHSTLQDPHPCSCSLSLSRAFCTQLGLSQNGSSWDMVFPEIRKGKGQSIQLQNILLT